MALCLWKFTVLNDVRSLTRIFLSEFLKLGHIVKYRDVFFRFDNSPYLTMFSAVMALCLWKFTVLNDVRSLSRIVFIRILWNLVTLFSTMMSSLRLIMVYMAPCLMELLPLVYEKSSVETTSALMNSFDYNSMKLGHIIKYHNVFKFQNGPYRIMPSGVIALC